MKLNYQTLFFALFLFVFSACSSDDDGVDQLPQEEQNQVDDEAIVLYLQDHYFNSVGKIVAFDDEDDADDNETPLIDIAQQVDGGYWFVKKPNFVANGRTITNPDTDSILIQYEMKTFYGVKSSDSVYYSTPATALSTINGTGYPAWDPTFYHYTTDDEDVEVSWYEIEGIQEGLKHFNSTDKAIDESPFVDFQGLIIVPSRLAFERDVNAYNILNDTSIILNFELYQVIDRQ